MQPANTVTYRAVSDGPSLASLAWLLMWALVPVAAAALAYPFFIPWMDEVQFIDPGVNWAFGQGFTSSVWPYQRPDELFMGNAPAFSALQGLWFQWVGFGWLQARSLSFGFAAGAAVVTWVAYRRMAPAVPSWLAGMAVAWAFCGYGVTFSLWSARYDTLGMLLAALLFLLLTRHPTSAVPRSGLLLLGACIFLSGFHLVIACVLLALVLFVVQGKRAVKPMLWLGAGTAVGAVLWLGLLAAHGQVKQFFYITLGSQHTVSGQLAQLVVQGDRGLMNKLQGAWRLLFQDPSWLVLVVGLLLVAAAAWRAVPSQSRVPAAKLSIGLVFAIPAGLLLAGKFPIYYVWMGYIPTALLLVWWAAHAPDSGRRWTTMASAAVLAVGSLAGVGRQMERVLHQGDPHALAAFQQWTQGVVRAGESVYSGFEAYPAARQTARRVFVPTYGQTRLVPGIPEADQISLVLANEAQLPLAKILLGEDWTVVSRFSEGSNPRLHYSALRRAKP